MHFLGHFYWQLGGVGYPEFSATRDSPSYNWALVGLVRWPVGVLENKTNLAQIRLSGLFADLHDISSYYKLMSLPLLILFFPQVRSETDLNPLYFKC